MIKSCSVKLVHLTAVEINRYTVSKETVDSDPTKESDSSPSSPPEFPQFMQSGYMLRARKSVANMEVEWKSNHDKKSVCYAESTNSSDSDKSPKPQKRRIKICPGSGPSLNRIRAQKHGKTKQPSQVEVSLIGSSQNSDNNDDSSDADDTVKPVPDPKENKPDSCTENTGTAVLKLKGAFKTTHHGVKHFRRKRSFKCSKCEYRCNTVKELNVHYRGNHSRSLCDICYKPFVNPVALKKHKLSHTLHKYPCRSCDKTFAYESQLKEHRIKHRRLAMHKCNRGNCPRVFKHESDLDKHVITHDEEHKCPDCTYTTNNKRLLRQHSQ